MNELDSARMLTLLGKAAYLPAESLSDADLVLLNTCSIREKADQKIYSALGRLRRWKRGREGRLVAVGGCLAQQEGSLLRERAPHVDIVFGTHNIARLPDLVRLAEEQEAPVSTDLTGDTSHWDVLPYLADGASSAMVTIMQGCDNYCAYCIVPYVRGSEISRPAAEILDEVRKLADRGVCEVVLLGQNVKAYGKKEGRSLSRAAPENRRHPADPENPVHHVPSEGPGQGNDRALLVDRIPVPAHPPAYPGGIRQDPGRDGTGLLPRRIPRENRRPPESEARDRVLLGFHRRISRGIGGRFPGYVVGHGGSPIRFLLLLPFFPPAGDPGRRDGRRRTPEGGRRAVEPPPSDPGPPYP